jgi:transcriptional regulator of acetoin/glycerol metabolism
LKTYRWPGNVRELRNICRFLAVQSWGRSEIQVEDLPQHTLEHGQHSYSDERALMEKEQLLEALETTDWQIAKAADLLGVGRNTVTRRMKRLGIKYTRTRT